MKMITKKYLVIFIVIIFSYSVTLFTVILVSSLFSLTSISAGSWISNKVILDLRVDMFAKLIRLPKTYFDKNTSGETLSKLTFVIKLVVLITSVSLSGVGIQAYGF